MAEIVAVMVIVLILGTLLWGWQRRSVPSQATLEHLKQRVANLQQMAETRKFHMPGDADLDPAVDYLNASKTMDCEQFEVVIFSAAGTVEQRAPVSSEELDRLVAAEQWQHTADRYHSVDGGLQKVHQFERRRSSP